MSEASFVDSSIADIESDVIPTESPPKITHVDIQFTIALAVPSGSPVSNESSVLKNNTSKNQPPIETSKVQGYYRIEYSLLPGAASVAFDIAVFRTAAKIYPDNQKAYLIPTWEDENGNNWIVWNHIHQLEFNREYLLALLSHKILVKIWDGRDFCTVRTKLDKPRIGRVLPNSSINGDEDNSPKNIVQNMAQNYADKWLAKPILHTLKRKLPIHIPPPSPFLQKKINDMEDIRTVSLLVLDAIQEKSSESFMGDSKLSFDETTINTGQHLRHSILKKNPIKTETKPVGNVVQKKGAGRTNKQNDEIKANGTAQIVVPSNLIIAGYKMITCRLADDPSLPRAIQDCFISINIDNSQLLNEILASEFNPLTINISYVENMPSTPISYSELKQRCEPVYCCYQLFDQPVYQTPKNPHARHIYWNDLHLYLTNLINENTMSQFRNSPILNIELHDRDELESTRQRVGSVFGSESDDEHIGRVSGKLKFHKSKNEPHWHPYGCVKLDLSELWLGQTSLEFYVPVVPCHAPELHSGRSSNENVTIQQGEFLSSGTQMKVVVRLAKPLVPPVEHRLLDDRLLPTTTISPFTRIVFVFPYDNMKFLTALQTCIRMINAKALGLDQQPAYAQVVTLSTYRLTEVQQADPNLNIITGFHLFDNEQHIFILEGRKEEAIDLLYEEIPKPRGQNVEILYDSSIHFNERLYVGFGIDLTHIKLSRTLRDIVSQPTIFVRDSLNKKTFEALEKLHQLVLVHRLNSSARHHLFPTMKMITSLNKDFGVPLTENEIKLFSIDDRVPSQPPSLSPPRSASTIEEKKMTENNTNYNSDIGLREEQMPPAAEYTEQSYINFVRRNMERVRHASLKNKENRPDEDKLVFVTTGPIYPYSTQKLNSTENALEQMRTYLKQHHRSASCSFNPDYPTHIYSPYSNEETVFDFHRGLRTPFDFNLTPTKDKNMESSSAEWINYAGHRTSRQANIHPKLPDSARLDELSKPPDEWYDENLNNRYPSVDMREPYKWTNRKDDFNRWTRPSRLSRSISAHWQPVDELNRTSSQPVTPTIIVADKRMHFLRRPAQTEMIAQGRLSASQLDRLTGMLKDKPVKQGLLLPKSYSRDNGSESVLSYSLTNTPDQRIYSTPITF